MDNLQLTKELLLGQLKKYPELQPNDLLKALYQSEFGCEHFVSDEEKGMNLLRQELDALPQTVCVEELIESIGNRFCRVHLALPKEHGLHPKTLFRLFMLTSRAAPGDTGTLSAKLDCFQEMCISGELPFNSIVVQSLISGYRESGFPAIHHSEAFRQHYSPAYRVVRRDFCELFPLFCRIDQLLAKKVSVIIAIDGSSAAGKTTLTSLLEHVYDCNVFHMDSFFLRPHQRTEKRLSEPGGNVDYERFYSEVLNPLIDGAAFSYRPYNCGTQKLCAPVIIQPKKLSIVEGVYSMHPALSDAYALSVFLRIDAELQERRILMRNGAEMQIRFLEEWIPMENRYFGDMKITDRCDMVLDADVIPSEIKQTGGEN